MPTCHVLKTSDTVGVSEPPWTTQCLFFSTLRREKSVMLQNAKCSKLEDSDIDSASSVPEGDIDAETEPTAVKMTTMFRQLKW